MKLVPITQSQNSSSREILEEWLKLVESGEVQSLAIVGYGSGGVMTSWSGECEKLSLIGAVRILGAELELDYMGGGG